MNNEPQLKLSETVVLVDAAFLNFVIKETKVYFEKVLKRSLQEIDVTELAICITLDAGLKEGNNAVQFYIVYDEKSKQLLHCTPSDLTEELNGVGFQSPFGEYAFAGVPSEGMVSRENLYLNLLSILADSSDVKRLIVVSFDEEYGEKVIDLLNEVEDKEIFQLRMSDPEKEVNYEWNILGFSIMHSLGVTADDLEYKGGN